MGRPLPLPPLPAEVGGYGRREEDPSIVGPHNQEVNAQQTDIWGSHCLLLPLFADIDGKRKSPPWLIKCYSLMNPSVFEVVGHGFTEPKSPKLFFVFFCLVLFRLAEAQLFLTKLQSSELVNHETSAYLQSYSESPKWCCRTCLKLKGKNKKRKVETWLLRTSAQADKDWEQVKEKFCQSERKTKRPPTGTELITTRAPQMLMALQRIAAQMFHFKLSWNFIVG